MKTLTGALLALVLLFGVSCKADNLLFWEEQIEDRTEAELYEFCEDGRLDMCWEVADKFNRVVNELRRKQVSAPSYYEDGKVYIDCVSNCVVVAPEDQSPYKGGYGWNEVPDTDYDGIHSSIQQSQDWTQSLIDSGKYTEFADKLNAAETYAERRAICLEYGGRWSERSNRCY